MTRPKPRRHFKKGTPIIVGKKLPPLVYQGRNVEHFLPVYVGEERRKSNHPISERRKGFFARVNRLSALQKRADPFSHLAKISKFPLDSTDSRSPMRKAEKLVWIITKFHLAGLPERFVAGGRRKQAGYRLLIPTDRGRTIPANLFDKAIVDAHQLNESVEHAMKAHPGINRHEAVLKAFKIPKTDMREWPAFRANKKGEWIGMIRFSGRTKSGKGILEIVYDPFADELRWMSTRRVDSHLRPLITRTPSMIMRQPPKQNFKDN